MTDTQLTIILAAIPPTITAIAGLIVSLRNSLKIEEVRHATNSMKDELVRTTADAEFAKGVKSEAQKHL